MSGNVLEFNREPQEEPKPVRETEAANDENGLLQEIAAELSEIGTLVDRIDQGEADLLEELRKKKDILEDYLSMIEDKKYNEAGKKDELTRKSIVANRYSLRSQIKEIDDILKKTK